MRLLLFIMALITLQPLQLNATMKNDNNILKKGNRLFSIAVTLPEMDNINDFWKVHEDAVDLTIDTGIDIPGELSFGWNEIEKRSFFGKISYQDDSSLKIIEIYKRKKIPVVVTITPFSTAVNFIPKDLQKLPFNHPDVIERFKKFIDWIYSSTEGLKVDTVVFGNEFDVFLSFEAANGRNRWTELEGMILETKKYVKSLPRWKDTLFSLEPTFDGLTGAHWEELQRINQHTDIIGVSYYPLQENNVHKPNIIWEDFANLLNIYPDKKFDFYQYGYPSSNKLNSSLEKQRQFVEETFKLWDKYKDKIRLITFTWLYDVQKVHLDSMTTETLGDITPTEAFSEFISSLGLHGRKIGEAKPAFNEIKKQLKLRNWQE